MNPLRALHHADTVAKAAGITMQATSSRGDAMLRRVLQQVVHQYGNGRAVANTRRETHKQRFEHERIEALVRRLSEPAREHNDRPAA
jgi:chorismate mutase